MKIGYQEQLVMIVFGVLLLITGLWALGSKKGVYVFSAVFGIIILLVALQYFNRNKIIKVKLQANEKVLYEEEGTKVNLRFFNKSEVAPDCKITLTNLRIIVGKRILFSTQYRESYHFYFSERNDNVPSPINFSAVVATISLNDITTKTRKDQSFIYLEPKSNIATIKNAELQLKEVNKFMEKLK